jgi:hypothetical protein
MFIKRNSFLLILLFLVSTIISSCGSLNSTLPVFYTPASTSNHVSYLPKPMMADSVKTKNYLSVSFSNNSLPYETGEMVMGFINYNRSHVLENINFSYGGFAYFGGTSRGYDNSERKISEEFYGKGFQGIGLRTSIGYAEQSGNTEFRVLNWENSLVFEGGSYPSFSKKERGKHDPLSVASDKTTLYTTGGSTEVIWYGKKNRDRQYGFRLFLGATLGLQHNINYTSEKINGMASDFSFFLKIRNAYGILSNGNNLMNNSGKITLGYSF